MDNHSEHYDGIGTRLAEVREARGISKDAVAHQMNLRVRIIDALESGDFLSLPGDAYIRGYLRNYAQLLGMDAREALTAYAEEQSGKPRAQKFFIPEPTVEGYRPGAAMIGLSLVLTAIIYVGGWLWWEQPKAYKDYTLPALPEVPAD